MLMQVQKVPVDLLDPAAQWSKYGMFVIFYYSNL